MSKAVALLNKLKQFTLWGKLFSIKYKSKKESETWYLARVACLGQDVLQVLDLGGACYNIQKGRVDHLNNIFKNKKNNIFLKEIAGAILRIDIIALIFQQKYFSFSSSIPPKAFILDSYSELTDQKFISKSKGYEVYLNFSDLDKMKTDKFECSGLLDLAGLTGHYRELFDQFNKKYPGRPILFIHFSTKLDDREKFKLREKKIKEAISTLELEFDNLHQYHAPEHLINWKENDDKFPYHYSNEVYKFLANEISSSKVLN